MKARRFSGEDTRKIGIFYPSGLKKLQSRVHTDGQLWLMDGLLRGITAFMPEKRDCHCEWQGTGVHSGALERMAGLRPRYQRDFFTKKERICLEYLFPERLHRSVPAVDEPLHRYPAGDRIQSVDVKALQQRALSRRRHLPAWTAWLAAVWHDRGKELRVCRDSDRTGPDPRPLVRKVTDRAGDSKTGGINTNIYNRNCPDGYRVEC